MKSFSELFEKVSIIFAVIAGIVFLVGSMITASMAAGLFFVFIVFVVWLILVCFFGIIYWLDD